MEINSSSENGVETVLIKDKLDAYSAPEFDKFFESLISEGKISVIVDLVGLEYISSAGLRSVLMLAEKIEAMEGGKVIFASLTGMVKEVFDISGFGDILQICESKEEALGKF